MSAKESMANIYEGSPDERGNSAEFENNPKESGGSTVGIVLRGIYVVEVHTERFRRCEIDVTMTGIRLPTPNRRPSAVGLHAH